MRNIAVVVDRLMAVIPESEEGLRKRLKAIAADPWKPPELLWRMGAGAFHERFGEEPPTEGWGKQAVDIWMGRDVDDETQGAVIDDSEDDVVHADRVLTILIAVLVVLGVVICFRYR